MDLSTKYLGLALKNPLLNAGPILFMQRRRAVGYMLYEYLGWYYAYGHNPKSGAKDPQFETPPTGGGVYLLERPGRTMELKELISERLPPGHYVTLALSSDAKTSLFSITILFVLHDISTAIIPRITNPLLKHLPAISMFQFSVKSICSTPMFQSLLPIQPCVII